ncbi:hypothetical protein CL684_01135 [Candidatus Campbellbacteria bacterium]|nr:hypothetical protein [Candidatus Campbellbacteria bacterium]|tara:strand:+ start:408 stop:758 length:351 start_codon:yes stop_codon:yes gene_type:complete
MAYQNKILIIEHDDFLRELIGNLLHKKGGYILNGHTIKRGIQNSHNHEISTIILGNSCPSFKGKQTLHYLKKELNAPTLDIFLLNHHPKSADYIPEDHQFMTNELSVKEILDRIPV